jgi:hypothetical protein
VSVVPVVFVSVSVPAAAVMVGTRGGDGFLVVVVFFFSAGEAEAHLVGW